MADDHPIIIKKVQGAHGGHHGGSWKVAYADFVTAMMALFLILWLLSVTSEFQRKAIADYFSNPGIFKQPSSNNPIKMEGTVSVSQGTPSPVRPMASVGTGVGKEDQDEEVHSAGIKNLQMLLKEIAAKFNTKPLSGGKTKPIIIQAVPRGILIRISETEERPMFAIGSAELTPYYEDILFELSPVLSKVKNHILISGHTDAAPYKGGSTMNNWGLSSMRAEATRKTLVFGGYPESQVLQLIAMADRALLHDVAPSDRRNRRVELLVLTEESEKIIRKEAQHKGRGKFESPLGGDVIDSVLEKAEINQLSIEGMGPPEE